MAVVKAPPVNWAVFCSCETALNGSYFKSDECSNQDLTADPSTVEVWPMI
jgi:hypothetical protein